MRAAALIRRSCAASCAAVLLAALGGVGCGAKGTTTDAGPGTCASPLNDSACGSCSTHADCSTCLDDLHPSGVEAFNALFDCVACNACYTACGFATGNQCASRPADAGSCDMPFGDADCTACQACAQNGQCVAETDACGHSAACAAIAGGETRYCTGLP